VDGERAARLDADAFPQLSAFVQGYLHQDFVVVHGTVADAARAWREDAGEAAAAALRDEWFTFLSATRGQTVAARATWLVEHLGGAWMPQSRRELSALTRALKSMTGRGGAPSRP
jgi:hypothetical protein